MFNSACSLSLSLAPAQTPLDQGARPVAIAERVESPSLPLQPRPAPLPLDDSGDHHQHRNQNHGHCRLVTLSSGRHSRFLRPPALFQTCSTLQETRVYSLALESFLMQAIARSTKQPCHQFNPALPSSSLHSHNQKTRLMHQGGDMGHSISYRPRSSSVSTTPPSRPCSFSPFSTAATPLPAAAGVASSRRLSSADAAVDGRGGGSGGTLRRPSLKH